MSLHEAFGGFHEAFGVLYEAFLCPSRDLWESATRLFVSVREAFGLIDVAEAGIATLNLVLRELL